MSEVFIRVDADGFIHNKRGLAEAFKLKEGKYCVKIERRNKRSLSQNSYFHGPMLDIILQGLRDAGYEAVRTKDHAKTVVKCLFLKTWIGNSETGEGIETIRDTSDLSKEEFGIFIDQVIHWAAEYLGCTIPAPGEQTSLSFEPSYLAQPIENNQAMLISK